MRLPDGHIFFTNSGEPPMSWEGEVFGDVIQTTAFGELRWDEAGFYVGTDPDSGKEVHLYANGSGGFSVNFVPSPPDCWVGGWRL